MAPSPSDGASSGGDQPRRAALDADRVPRVRGAQRGRGAGHLRPAGGTDPAPSTSWREATSADPDTLLRLLHALATIGVYDRGEDGSFTNTSLGEGLRSDVEASMRPLARTLQDPAVWAAWGHLRHSVVTGENAFAALHGTDVWTHRAAHPEHNAVFNDNMTMLSSMVADAVAAAYDFSGLTSVVDVGGGHGILLAAILARHPHLTGTVFDLAQAVADEPPAAPRHRAGPSRREASSTGSPPATRSSSSRSCTTGRTTGAWRS